MCLAHVTILLWSSSLLGTFKARVSMTLIPSLFVLSPVDKALRFDPRDICDSRYFASCNVFISTESYTFRVCIHDKISPYMYPSLMFCLSVWLITYLTQVKCSMVT